MGQKINPIGLRAAVNHDWRSRWFADDRQFGAYLNEDQRIRDHLRRRLENAAVKEVLIERYANRVRVTIHSARPAVVIGPRGKDAEMLRGELEKLTEGREVFIDVRDVPDPDTHAQLVAENIALQLCRRISFRRALKRAIKTAMDARVEGIKIQVGGRLGGAELSRTEWYKEGRVPLHTLREAIDYGFAEARTTAGALGVKVWICRKPEAPRAEKGKTHAVNA